MSFDESEQMNRWNEWMIRVHPIKSDIYEDEKSKVCYMSKWGGMPFHNQDQLKSVGNSTVSSQVLEQI